MKKDFGISKPKLAVLGLNPHAGEEGLLGLEEKDIIAPVIDDAKNNGDLVFGPYPADGFFGSSNYKKYDAVLAMYHDQGLIPFKSLSFGSGVNFTANLSIVRTSPDHGTAFDIAGTGKSSETSMREAIYLAHDILKNRDEEVVGEDEAS
jgi:4-hydroxythreonine-4-phosphate dehydrogenase